MSDFFDSEPAREARKREDSERDAKAEGERPFGGSKSVPRASSERRGADSDSDDNSDEVEDEDDASDVPADAGGPPKAKRVPKRKTRGFVEVKKPGKPQKSQDRRRSNDEYHRDDMGDRDNEDDDDEDLDDEFGARNEESKSRSRAQSRSRDHQSRSKDSKQSADIKSRPPINKKVSLDSQLRESNARREKEREEEEELPYHDEDYEDPDYDDKFAIRVFEAEDQNLVQKYFALVNGVLFNPKKFFAALPPEGIIAPTIFLCVSAGIYAFLQALGHLNPLLLVSSFFSSIFYTASGAAIVWGVFNKACKGRGTLVETYRVLAYSKATLLFAWIMAGSIPLGGYLSVAYTLFLNYIGLKKVHRLNTMMTAGIVMALGALAFAFKKMMPF